MKKGNIVVGLDIGTTKICAIVAEISDDGVPEIIGVGKHPSRGLNKGVVVNIDSTVESVKAAVEEAEHMAGVDIHSVYVGIAGGHIRGFNSHGIVAIKTREVSQGDIDRVVDAAKAVNMPLDHEVIHVLPQEFIIDEQDGITAPMGMCGVRLEGKVHIVTGAVNSAQNIVKSVNRAGLDVDDFVLEPLASSLATLTEDEKELGVSLLDMGGGTTDIAVFAGGGIRHTSVLTLGGNHITNDIAIGLRTPQHEAEKIKKRWGCALGALGGDGDDCLEVSSVGDRGPRVLSRHTLVEIIEPRVEEIFRLAKREIQKSGLLDFIVSGVVITGGSTLMKGMPEVAEQVFDLPVRRGLPTGIGGLVEVVRSPIYSTGVGLVLYGCQQNGRGSRFRIRDRNLFNKTLGRMKNWFGEFFN